MRQSVFYFACIVNRLLFGIDNFFLPLLRGRLEPHFEGIWYNYMRYLFLSDFVIKKVSVYAVLQIQNVPKMRTSIPLLHDI